MLSLIVFIQEVEHSTLCHAKYFDDYITISNSLVVMSLLDFHCIRNNCSLILTIICRQCVLVNNRHEFNISFIESYQTYSKHAYLEDNSHFM